MQTEKAILSVRGNTIELPVIEGTSGPPAIDVGKLYGDHGWMTYDPSLASTALAQSEITYIDGERGLLRYRGIPIEQFATRPNFVEVAWLLVFGDLPSQDELCQFSDLLTENELLHEGLRHQFNEIPPNAPPMALLSATLNNLACYDQEYLTLDNPTSFIEAAAQLISKVRTIAAFSYRRSRGLPFIYPDPHLRYCANFLHMMFSIPYRQYEILPEVEDALNLILILHADHEQNCSTATVRMVGSAKANLFAACAAGVCALWGPLHGGANVKVIEMLEAIHTGGMTPEECIREARNKNGDFRLYGFGHRVYRNFDPRASILRESCDSVFQRLKHRDPLLDIARRLEELALADTYFQERHLYPNVDFYSGILLRAMGIPANMFTVCFAMGRLPGWIAHWYEQHEDPAGRILRPRQVYAGPEENEYIPLEQRAR